MPVLHSEMLWLPWPPTSNTMFAMRGHRRFVSKRYQAWRDEAGIQLMQQKPSKFDGPVELFLRLAPPTKRKWDLDNRVKPILDLLVIHQIIQDDNASIVRRIDVMAEEGAGPGALVTIKAA